MPRIGFDTVDQAGRLRASLSAIWLALKLVAFGYLAMESVAIINVAYQQF